MSDADRAITALFPGLLGPQPELAQTDPAARPDLSTLESLLTHATARTFPAGGLSEELARLLQIPVPADEDFPWAALSGLADDLDTAQGWWLRIDPVYLQADRDRVFLLAHEELHLTRAQADALVASLNAHFKADGWHIHAPHPQRWYLRLEQPAAIRTTTLYEAFGHDVHRCLPVGEARSRWHTWLNECQMLLAEHPVNVEREAHAQMPVNSIWPWGGGRQPARATTPWHCIVADEPALRGWARLHDLAQYSPARGLPAQLDGPLLLLDLACNEARQLQDVFAWFDCVEHVQQHYLQELRQRLEQGNLDRVLLLDGNGRGWELTRPQWRRSRWCPGWCRDWRFRRGRRKGIERFMLPETTP